ncbi:ribonuclease J [Flexistipes sp.]|uniref:ribonuclease J n=1 Tax=Flexistipes sp. TaxID=3088135 RepID=UPI002E1AFFBE|nr:ribonuclease J [Flexistipes sp.]
MSFDVTFLGGAGVIGMNMYLYESSDTALIVDCGVMFADYSCPGVDYIIPDFRYLYKKREKLKALLLSHGHEDHIGGVPYLLKDFNIPVYSGELTLKFLKAKLGEHKIKGDLNAITPGDSFKVGDFTVSFNPVNHSIPETYSVLLSSNDFSFLHCSDFKIDDTPVSGEPFNRKLYKKIGSKGIDAVLIDSTNVFEKGKTVSESSLKNNLLEIFRGIKARIFFTTFSSNIDRIKQVLEVCRQLDRKVVFEGRSILKNTLLGNEAGYLPFPEDTVVKLSEAKDLPDDRICYIVSGCQGEAGSSLFKIVSRERKKLQIQEGDTVVISSRVIPGNEKNLNALMNQVAFYGGYVVDMDEGGIHASGHAGREDIKEFISLVRPKKVIPVHGEFRHQKAVCKMVMEDNLAEECIFAITGEKLVFSDDKKNVFTEEVEIEKRYVDTRGDFLFSEEQLKERRQMARDGVVIINAYSVDEKVHIDTTGFVLSNNSFFRLRKFLSENLILLNDVIKDDKNKLAEMAMKLTKTFFKKNMDRRPVIKVFIRGEKWN